MNPLFPGINPEPIEPHIELLQADSGAKNDAMPGWPPTEMQTASAPSPKTAASSIRTSASRFCCAGCWSAKSGQATWFAPSTPRSMVDRIAAKYGRKLHECPIGFKYIADLMMDHEIVIGGEESGGIGYSRYLPERDGLLNSLLLANVMAEEGKPLGELVADLQARVRAALLRAARPAHSRDTVKQGAIQRARSETTRTWEITRSSKKRTWMGSNFFWMLHQRQWRHALGSVPGIGNRASIAGLFRSRNAGIGHRNSGSRQDLRFGQCLSYFLAVLPHCPVDTELLGAIESYREQSLLVDNHYRTAP